jgi:hypothetical protein
LEELFETKRFQNAIEAVKETKKEIEKSWNLKRKIVLDYSKNIKKQSKYKNDINEHKKIEKTNKISNEK